jgi:predicted RNase H-like nuclease (RuvC/YqgF family)
VVILTIIIFPFFVWQGLILSKALKAQKDVEDESYQMAIGNLQSEVITLRNEALEKDKILISLVERLKSNEAKMSTQAELHSSEIQELEKKLGKATENFNVELTKRETSDIKRLRVQKMLKSFVKLKRNATMLLQNVPRI